MKHFKTMFGISLGLLAFCEVSAQAVSPATVEKILTAAEVASKVKTGVALFEGIEIAASTATTIRTLSAAGLDADAVELSAKLLAKEPAVKKAGLSAEEIR